MYIAGKDTDGVGLSEKEIKLSQPSQLCKPKWYHVLNLLTWFLNCWNLTLKTKNIPCSRTSNIYRESFGGYYCIKFKLTKILFQMIGLTREKFAIFVYHEKWESCSKPICVECSGKGYLTTVNKVQCLVDLSWGLLDLLFLINVEILATDVNMVCWEGDRSGENWMPIFLLSLLTGVAQVFRQDRNLFLVFMKGLSKKFGNA